MTMTRGGWVMLHVQSNPLPSHPGIEECCAPVSGRANRTNPARHAAPWLDTAFGIDATYTPAGGEPVQVRVIAKRPDTIVA